MHYSVKRGIAIACRPSVRLSVCDVGGSGLLDQAHIWLEILETNSTGNKPNIFALHSPKAIQLHPRPPTASSPLIGCSQPQPKTSTDITSGTCKATDFKLGQYIYRVHPNKSSEKKAWAHPETAQSFWIPLLSREQVKQRTSNFVSTFTDRSKQRSMKNFGKSSRGRTRGLTKIFTAAIYKAHHAVIFAIAQLSCITAYQHSLLRRALCQLFCLSVCPSVTVWYHVKVTPATITQSSLKDSLYDSSFLTVNFTAKFQREHKERGHRMREV